MAVYKLSNAGGFTSKQRYTSMLAGNAAYDPAAMQWIASASGNGSSNAITFSTIPTTYRVLQIRYVARTTRAFASEGWYIRFNGDAGSNYYGHYLYSTEGTGGAQASTNGAGTTIDLPNITGASASASMPGVGVVDVYDYANTSKLTSVKSIGGLDNNGTGFVYLQAYFWQNTATVTSLQILSNGALDTGTRVDLFGIL